MQLDRPFSSVTSSLDGDVLGVLASAPDARFTTGQLHRILGRFSQHGIRKVLTRLAGQGLVLVEQVGNASSYTLNQHHLAAEPVKLLAQSRIRLIKELTMLIDGWEQRPLFAALFGSVVHGVMTPDSDIDVLVVRRDDDSQLVWDSQHVDLQLVTLRATGNRVDVVFLTESEVTSRGPDELLGDVLAFGARIGGDRARFERALRAKRIEHDAS